MTVHVCTDIANRSLRPEIRFAKHYGIPSRIGDDMLVSSAINFRWCALVQHHEIVDDDNAPTPDLLAERLATRVSKGDLGGYDGTILLDLEGAANHLVDLIGTPGYRRAIKLRWTIIKHVRRLCPRARVGWFGSPILPGRWTSLTNSQRVDYLQRAAVTLEDNAYASPHFFAPSFYETPDDIGHQRAAAMVRMLGVKAVPYIPVIGRHMTGGGDEFTTLSRAFELARLSQGEAIYWDAQKPANMSDAQAARTTAYVFAIAAGCEEARASGAGLNKPVSGDDVLPD